MVVTGGKVKKVLKKIREYLEGIDLALP